MTPTSIPVSVVASLSAGDVRVVRAALAQYALKGWRQRTEVGLFAGRHPEFGLLTIEQEPAAEEDR